MSFFDKLFAKKTAAIAITSPINGNVVPASQIPDPTFAENLLGPCVGIDPKEGVVYAPCDAEVTQIFRTCHAVTLTSTDGVELLIHVGINTVDLKGEGFEACVKDGDKVKKGQPLIKFDINFIKEKGLSPIVPVVLCNAQDFKEYTFAPVGAFTNNDVLITLTK